MILLGYSHTLYNYNVLFIVAVPAYAYDLNKRGGWYKRGGLRVSKK